MTINDYIQEAHPQLRDETNYRSVPNNYTDTHMKQLQSTVYNIYQCGEIDEKCKEYQADFEPRTAKFYLLPKLHKNQRRLPGRPIILANRCSTECVSEFVDHFLKPLVPTIKSYIEDTTHFVKVIRDIPVLPGDTLLVTLDVTLLYTNIPNNKGMRACAKTLARHRPTTSKPSTSNII